MRPFLNHAEQRSLVALLAAFLLYASAAVSLNAQDVSLRQLEHKDYDAWSTLAFSQISRNGNWVAYALRNGAIDGEATLHVHNTKNAREYVIERSTSARFTWDSRFLVYRVTPEKKKIKELVKKKTKPSDLPKSKIQILELQSGEVTTIDRVRSYQLPEENSDWIACLLEKPLSLDKIDDKPSGSRESYDVTNNGLQRPKKTLQLKSREELARERGEMEPPAPDEKKEKQPKKNDSGKDSEDDDDEKKKAEGTPLVLINLDTGVQRTFPSVVSYVFSKNGKQFAFATSVEPEESKSSNKDSKADDSDDAEPVDGVHVIELLTLKRTTVASGTGEYKNMVFNDDGSQLAFITNKDDYKTKTSAWALYHWAARSKQAKKIAAEKDAGMKTGWWVAPNSSQSFSEDGKRLYFETAPLPDKVVKEREAAAAGRDVKDDDSEKAKLDIWHWQDPQLQPQQLLQAQAERNRDYSAAYVIKSKKIVQLEDRQVPDLLIDRRSPAGKAVANTNVKYRKLLSGDIPGFQDAYLVNLDTGERAIALEKVKASASLSPNGEFITWFDGEQKKWFAKSTKNAGGEPIEISQGIQQPLQNELHDTPNLPRAYGSAGWIAGDSGFLVYDSYDIWQLDPTGKKKPVCITEGFGRKNNIRFRYRQLDNKQREIDPAKPMLLNAFNRKTKASGFYQLTLQVTQNDKEDQPAKKKRKRKGKSKKNANAKPAAKPEPSLRKLIMLDESLRSLQKAQDGDKLIFTRSTFRDCPDLWSSDMSFKKIHRVSDMNPQQENFSWGDAELVHWKATDGQKLDGILIKPDGFDPAKKYPMMVYFYERKSDDLHSYYTPAAGRSIICHSFYASRGYVVFIPDIPYKTGAPGPSAANSILPGVQHVIKQGFVDPAKVGMQGHSWGGYQTAYLVTQTDMFACAESGAPVSNMTSAYGGIRWGTGMSRMFQYERTQSRIGDDLWSARDKYIANSPVFFADKVNTPLLILHNDQDGAVPWYQGIELFVALRRLEKPAWMLNYNGDPHWVMGEQNRRDFAIRMQQFFDHYLKDAPEPEWMAVGVRAVDKGKEFGLELLESKKTTKPKTKSKPKAKAKK